jgi:hypothetical protein
LKAKGLLGLVLGALDDTQSGIFLENEMFRVFGAYGVEALEKFLSRHAQRQADSVVSCIKRGGERSFEWRKHHGSKQPG